MKSIAILALLLSLASCQAVSLGFAQAPEVVANPKNPTAENFTVVDAADTDGTPSTPEVALRKFMLAMASGDLKKLKSITHPHDDIQMLLPKEKPPEMVMNQMKEMFQAIQITKLKVGDSVKLPSGQSVTFDESQINENRAMVTFPNNPVPFPAARIDGAWKINPKTIIAVRKASIRLMQEQGNANSPAVEKDPERK